MDLTGMVWRKSSYSGSAGGDCVEVAAVWQKSSYSSSNGANCVEVARPPSEQFVAVRDSKDPDGPKLLLTPSTWRTFTAALKDGSPATP
jgi:hypothetical protein